MSLSSLRRSHRRAALLASILLASPVLAATVLAGLLLAAPAFANGVPTALADQADHLGRTFTVDVMANDTEPDGEALTLTVTGKTCPNTVIELDGLIQVQTEPDDSTPQGYSVGCTITYRIEDEHGFHATATLMLTAQTFPLFSDGFELGNTSAWSYIELNTPSEDI